MYYKPGSMKAKLCVLGNKLTYNYCNEKNIPYKKIGKLIVATTPEEIQNLKVIYDRAIANNVEDVSYLSSPKDILSIEPNCTGGLEAIHCKSTGIVDWREVCDPIPILL